MLVVHFHDLVAQSFQFCIRYVEAPPFCSAANPLRWFGQQLEAPRVSGPVAKQICAEVFPACCGKHGGPILSLCNEACE